MPDELHFRQVMANCPTGVTVVTSRTPDGRPCGLTANSLASVSLKPLPVLVCVDREAASHTCIIEGGSFAVSVLERLARFEDLDYRTEATDSPVLHDALAWLDCRVTAVYEARTTRSWWAK